MDVTTIKVLTEALREFTGTAIVISHDRTFLDDFQPTHVLTVREGRVTLEERGLREDDWNDILGSREAAKFASNAAASTPAVKSASTSTASITQKEQQQTETKKKNNGKSSKSGKQASKLESSIAKLEKQLLEIDENMAKFFKDGNKMSELKKTRKEVQSKLDGLFEEFSTL